MFRRRTTVKKTEVTLSSRDQYILNTYTRRMKKYEEVVYVCCFWVGYDLLLDLIPVVGKVISLIFSLSMYRLACQAELPRKVRKRMLYHLTVDFLLYRAHTKNTKLLRKYLYERARQVQEASKLNPQLAYEINTGSITQANQTPTTHEMQPVLTPEIKSAPALDIQTASTLKDFPEDSKTK
ncbi:hypothetical protein BJ944DRAFT_240794 [Cunninghamella echinulata]|nr:hypothetical protein BJ944DRAFT_240794 [Cunninghamella echinulata]